MGLPGGISKFGTSSFVSMSRCFAFSGAGARGTEFWNDPKEPHYNSNATLRSPIIVLICNNEAPQEPYYSNNEAPRKPYYSNNEAPSKPHYSNKGSPQKAQS